MVLTLRAHMYPKINSGPLQTVRHEIKPQKEIIDFEEDTKTAID